MASREAEELADRIVSGLVAQRAAEEREKALIERSREQIQPLPGDARANLRSEIRLVGKTGDLDLILDIEKRLLSEELQNEVAAPGQATALENSLKDLNIAVDMVGKVRDPAAYREVASHYRRDRSRVGGVPKD